MRDPRVWMALFLALMGMGMALALLGGVGLVLASTSPPSPQITPVPLPDVRAAFRALHPRSGQELDITVITTTADTFVAGGHPYAFYNFGQEEILLVGRDQVMGELRTYTYFRIPVLPPGAQFLEAALAFGVAGGNNDFLIPISVTSTSSWNEYQLTWENQPLAGEAVPGVLGPRGEWSFIDVTSLVQPLNTYESGSISLRLSAPYLSGTVWKGSWSREGNPELAPHLLIAYQPDRIPPTCELAELPTLVYGSFTVTWSAHDGESRLQQVLLQRRVDDGPWENWEEHIFNGAASVSYPERESAAGMGGRRLQYRCRATDRAGNVGSWSAVRQTQVYGQPPRVVNLHMPAFVRQGVEITWQVEGHPEQMKRFWTATLQMRTLPEGAWQQVPTHMQGRPGPTSLTLGDLSPWAGQQIRFRLRVTDAVGNASAWVESDPVWVYRSLIKGTVQDNREQPLPLQLEVFPPPLQTSLDPATAVYTVHVGTAQLYTLTFRAQEKVLTSHPVWVSDEDREIEIRTGAGSEQVANGGFEQELASWSLLASPESTRLVTAARTGDQAFAIRSGGQGQRIPGADISTVTASFWALPLPQGRTLLLAGGFSPRAWIQAPDGTWQPQEPPPVGSYVRAWHAALAPDGRAHVLSFLDTGQHMYTVLEPDGTWRQPEPLEGQRTGGIAVDAQGRVHIGLVRGSDIVYRRRAHGVWEVERTFPVTVREPEAGVVVVGEKVWLLARGYSSSWTPTLCWAVSQDGGDSWGEWTCEPQPAAHVAIRRRVGWAFRAGDNGPFAYIDTELLRWEEGEWVPWGQMREASVVGCPDGSVWGLAPGWTEKGEAFLSGWMWRPTGEGGERFLVRWGINAITTTWCDERAVGAIWPESPAYAPTAYRLLLQPERTPVLSQRVRVPEHAPTLGLFLRLDGPASDLAQVSVVVSSGGAGTHELVQRLPMGTWQYAWADLSPFAGEEVTLTVAAEVGLDPFPADILVDDISLRSQPHDLGLRGVLRGNIVPGETVTATLWVDNNRPMTVGKARLSLTWSTGYTLTGSTLPVLETVPPTATVLLPAMLPDTTEPVTLTFRVPEHPVGPFSLSAMVLPVDVDAWPRDNPWWALLLDVVRQRLYMPKVLQ